MSLFHHYIRSTLYLALLLTATACAPAVNPPATQQTVTVDKSFQSQLSPVPTTPTYRCAAWTSDRAPYGYNTITIYVRLTKDLTGVSGATAKAVVHFKAGDQTLDQQPVSDSGGYVTFSLPLQGRQPSGLPTTVDVSFTLSSQKILCTPAFFTPQ